MRLGSPRRIRRAEAGYTLLELAIAAGVFAIVGSILAAVMVMLLRFNSRGASDVETERLARVVLTHMARELREASADAAAFAVWPWDDGDGIRAFGFVSPRRETQGRPFAADPEGRPRWRSAVYYVHERETQTLHRIVRAWDGSLADPEDAAGRLVARAIRRMALSRRGDVVTIALDLTAGARAVVLEATARPRN